MTLLLEDVHGNSASVVLPGPGGTIRVVVGEPGRQSGVWRIWAPQGKSDVYIGVRAILGFQKWSLHESGDWRFQWVSEEKAGEFANTVNRIIDQWRQPAEIGESGWTKGFSIRVRHQDLVDVANPEPVPADAVWIPAPPEGHVAAVHVVIARPDQAQITLRGLVPFGGFVLADGRVLLVVASVEPVTAEHNQIIETAIAEVLKQAPQGVDLSAVGAPRMLMGGNNAEGDRSVWDVAVTTPGAQGANACGESTGHS